MMQEVFILSACRTPIGRFRGSLVAMSATDLGAVVVREAVSRAGIQSDEVDEVILGNVLSAGTGQAPARQSALRAGLPPSVSALTINKVCGSGLKAVMLADQAVRCGDAEAIVAGGMESMSQAPLVLSRESSAIGNRVLIDSLINDGLTCSFTKESMGVIAENLVAQSGVSRAAQDEYSLESHRRATAAIESGAFAAEIVSVDRSQNGNPNSFTQDEGPRVDTTLYRLASLPTAFRSDGTITAGNASTISDGAAAVVVGSTSIVALSKNVPLARIVATAVSGGPPEDLFTAPVQAIRKVVAKAGCSLTDIDLFEINEAFAVQVLVCIQQLELPPDRVNVNGGAIALGHPIGASGARVLVTLVHELRRQGGGLGIAALCLGGGNAVAMLIEQTGS